MLQKSPDYQKRLDDSSEANALHHEQRRMQLLRRGMGALGVGLFIAVHLTSYATDVHENKEIQADANVDVSLVARPLHSENAHSGVVMIDGFGSNNSLSLAEHRAPIIQQIPELDGNVYSVNYNNASLDIETIATDTAKVLKHDGINEITMVGYSAGGNIMYGVEDYLEKYNFAIKANILESVPNGADRLQPARQNEVDIVKTLKHVPGAQYSTPLRFIGEMAFRAGGYSAPLSGDTVGENIGIAADNVKNFFTIAGEVKDDLHNKALPGTWLMFDQVLAVENGNFKDHVENLGKLPNTTLHPTQIYIGNATDGVVDNIGSEKDLQQYTTEANLPYISFNVPDAVHGRPDLGTDAFKKAFLEHKDAITQTIEREKSVASMNQMFAKIALKAEKQVKAEQAQQKADEKAKKDKTDINAEDDLHSANPVPVATPAP